MFEYEDYGDTRIEIRKSPNGHKYVSILQNDGDSTDVIIVSEKDCCEKIIKVLQKFLKED